MSNPLALAARNHLLQALEADLVGPFQPDQADTFEEVLSLPPSRWYLTGFLAPEEGREAEPERVAVEDGEDSRLDPTLDEELSVGPDDEGEDSEPGGETEPKQKNRLPASMGMTLLLPPGRESDVVRATVAFADYVPEEVPDAEKEEEGSKKKRPLEVWRRVAGAPVTVEVRLHPPEVKRGIELPGTDGVWLMGRLETVTGAPDRMPVRPGTRALSLFVVNRRRVKPQSRPDEAMIFQVRLEIGVGFGDGIVARPNRKGEASDDWDDRVADLQFRHRCEHAVGHGVSVAVPPQPEPVRIVRTTWIPCAQVHRVEERREPAVMTAMEVLAVLKDGGAARQALEPLVKAYGDWIEGQRRIDLDTAGRRKTRDDLMDLAGKAQGRIAEGIALLERDAEALEAFRLANRAMAMAARRSREYKEDERPQWRLFQLAFVLLNLSGLTDDRHEDRETVELIFFPTGGGKTEAYLGVIAFTLVLRRMRGRSRPDAGLGVAVLLRYTLRLLTLDQLARAATLICALESLRRIDTEKLGNERFAVGLWVGKSATANRMSEVDDQIKRYKSRQGQSPFPLTNCPWCNEELGADSLTVQPKSEPREVVVTCLNHRGCEFSASRNSDGLPVLFVDEQIYRELPGFLVATVDKFAMLPWRGEAGMLFGRVHTRQGRRFAGPVDGPFHPGKNDVHLPEGLRPPELIVQDELHLISGPLGTMVGLYETAIEALSTSRDGDGRPVLPKILASTATVRRAKEQIRALFGRERTAVFPPAGVDDSETWFAEVDRESPGRLYVGVAASGRAMKAILLRAHVVLLAAASGIYDPGGPEDQPADVFMTLAGYFSSLRELGAMRRLVEDEVRVRCAQAEKRAPVGWPGAHPWFRNREIQIEPAELTSRESTAKIAATRSRLKKKFSAPDHVDVLLASSMISVGVDIDRLGLMVVAGQPKATSEYIQASSRVGRRKDRPGLVVTCFNVHKPRDRSHYERFAAFHESFYRFVEASSLTPFSGPALDRGLAGALVAMTRHGEPEMTPPRAAMLLQGHRQAAEAAVRGFAERAADQSGLDATMQAALKASLVERGKTLLDAWERLIEAARAGAFARSYSRFEADRAQKQLLRTALDDPGTATADEERFSAPTSMRDVEPVTHLWIHRRQLGGRS